MEELVSQARQAYLVRVQKFGPPKDLPLPPVNVRKRSMNRYFDFSQSDKERRNSYQSLEVKPKPKAPFSSDSLDSYSGDKTASFLPPIKRDSPLKAIMMKSNLTSRYGQTPSIPSGKYRLARIKI